MFSEPSNRPRDVGAHSVDGLRRREKCRLLRLWSKLDDRRRRSNTSRSSRVARSDQVREMVVIEVTADSNTRRKLSRNIFDTWSRSYIC